MPWKAVSTMSLRAEFVALAGADGANVRALCRQFGISAPTGYKWLTRFGQAGQAGLADASRRPHSSPSKTDAALERAVVALRKRHPAWGARKLRTWLLNHGHRDLPSASTIQAILTRVGLIRVADSAKHRAFVRFEHAAPNDLWQMDFKGHFALTSGARCHPLTVLDDHSRYALRLAACQNEQHQTVQEQLIGAFRRYGLPQRMLMDNGSPWSGGRDEPYTALTVWLLRLGIGVTHGRPYHPQTQGKDERFHRTLKAEVLQWEEFATMAACQRRFDIWRDVYNLERPHEALAMKTPVTRFRPSERSYPERLPPIEYGPDDLVRKITVNGELTLRGHAITISKAFRGERLALRPTTADGVWDVYYGQQSLGQLHMSGPTAAGVSAPTFVRCAHYGRRRNADTMETTP
jgi:transposase InsO family protein